jgi:hypothetical protein
MKNRFQEAALFCCALALSILLCMAGSLLLIADKMKKR